MNTIVDSVQNLYIKVGKDISKCNGYYYYYFLIHMPNNGELVWVAYRYSLEESKYYGAF